MAKPPKSRATHNGRETNRSLSDQAYEGLEEMIVTLHLEPGAVLSEAELSEQLGIGRTPIREALQRLARVVERRQQLLRQGQQRCQVRRLRLPRLSATK